MLTTAISIFFGLKWNINMFGLKSWTFNTFKSMHFSLLQLQSWPMVFCFKITVVSLCSPKRACDRCLTFSPIYHTNMNYLTWKWLLVIDGYSSPESHSINLFLHDNVPINIYGVNTRIDATFFHTFPLFFFFFLCSLIVLLKLHIYFLSFQSLQER